MSKTLCFCHLVTDLDVDEAVLDGVVRFLDLQRRTGACTGCGGCRYDVHSQLEKSKVRHLGDAVSASDPFEGAGFGLDFLF
jgi:bacterioferritin-associated ferredoxin